MEIKTTKNGGTILVPDKSEFNTKILLEKEGHL